MHMADLETNEFEDPHTKRMAIKNAAAIKSNIMKLVKHFRRDDLQAKLSREFRDATGNRNVNEIGTFMSMFDKTKQLWFTKLATSFEDHERM